MCNRYLGFLLLIWCPGELHAQSATQSCSAPSLDGGKFSPKRETYAPGTYVTYSCDLGRKPAVEGWWARSTCENGTWSPQPRCIMERDCIPPTIPNAKNTESLTGWYEDGDKIRITCDEAYELKNNDATALCTNGSWSSVPVCERSADACDAPPKIPHAVIVDHRRQELFAADTQLQYECEDGYTAEGAGNDKTIVCIAGTWTEGPTCRTGGGNTTSAGSGTPPAGGGSSSSSGSNTGDTERRLTSVEICGDPPKIPKAVVVRTFRRSVKYSCQQYYKLLGPESVRCYSVTEAEPGCAKAQLAFNTCEGFLTKRN
ncbi:complement factor H-related protein 1-like isoform 1-T1 [Acanthopagrus schlegelii]